MATYTITKTVTITDEAGDEQDFDVTLEFDYCEAERGSREYGTGLQLEPDYPASMELCSATTKDGVDLLDKMTVNQIEQLEITALEEAEEPGEEPDYDPCYDDDDGNDYIGPW
jgi:hypothetical protein